MCTLHCTLMPDNIRYYFQLLSPEAPGAYGFYSIIKYFGWRKVGIITQGENLFIAVSSVMMFEEKGKARVFEGILL